MNDQPKPKMNIEKDAQELKIYMFTVQGGAIKIDLPEDFKAVMAYNDADALNVVRKDYPADLSLLVKKRAQVEVRKIIDIVNLQPAVPQKIEFLVAPPPSKEKTMQDFIYGMLLISDKFVIDKRDQASLKRIISKIKYEQDKN